MLSPVAPCVFLLNRNGREGSTVLHGPLLSRSLCDSEPERDGQTAAGLRNRTSRQQLSLFLCAASVTVALCHS